MAYRTEEEEEMIIDIEDDIFRDASLQVKVLIIDFIARATRELTSNEITDFYFKVKSSDGYLIVYLIYENEESCVLDWHITLQEDVENLASAYGIDFDEEFYDGVLLLIEHRDLWK